MEKKDTYFEGIGRRKTSTARVRIFTSSKFTFIVNGLDFKDYFKKEKEKKIVLDAVSAVSDSLKNFKFSIEVKISGGGSNSQAEAIRHGLSRALLKSEPSLRENLKELGYLKRDGRAKERRKFGLKKARKAPKWSKR